MSTLRNLQAQSRWLLNYAANVTSETGEDGILHKILELLPGKNQRCIEFGAWDGKHLSNTYNLIATMGYRGVLIEPRRARFLELQRMHDPQKHILINAFVGFGESDSLDAMLANYPIPADPDVLSIDIDGNDYYAWAAINRIRAKIVVIEFNPTIANAVYFVQKRDPKVMQGASPAALVELGQKKGYELIAVTAWNLIFVDARYYDLFHIPDNSLEVMREEKYVRHVFMGTDGKVLLEYAGEFGSVPLHWHYPIRLYESSLQPLPKILQYYKPDYDRFRLFLFRVHWRLRRLLHGC